MHLLDVWENRRTFETINQLFSADENTVRKLARSIIKLNGVQQTEKEGQVRYCTELLFQIKGHRLPPYIAPLNNAIIELHRKGSTPLSGVFNEHLEQVLAATKNDEVKDKIRAKLEEYSSDDARKRKRSLEDPSGEPPAKISKNFPSLTILVGQPDSRP